MKTYIILILGMITTISMSAQEQKHYFNLNTGGGLHKVKYNLQDGNVKGGSGTIFNLGYSYFFKPSWGFNTGLGLLSAKANGTVNFFSEKPLIDEDGDSFVFRTRYNSLKEKQTALFLDVPIGLQYQHWFTEKTGLLAATGVKVFIPIRSGYKVNSGSITTTGYYEQWNVELSDMPQHDFSSLMDKPSGDLKMKTSISLYAELGGLYKLSQQFDMYLGAYMNFGINNLINAGSNPVYSGNGDYNSMLASTQTNKVNVTSFGVKIGLRLRVKSKKKITDTYISPIVAVVEPESVQQPVVQVDTIPQVVETLVVDTIPEPVVSIKDTIAKSQAIASQIEMKFPLNLDVPLNDVFDDKFGELAQMLIAYPTMTVRIQGHTCNLASREYNFQVGKSRAEVGKAKLIKLGVPESQIIVESKAFDEPLVPNTNEDYRAKNRRIELIIE